MNAAIHALATSYAVAQAIADEDLPTPLGFSKDDALTRLKGYLKANFDVATRRRIRIAAEGRKLVARLNGLAVARNYF